MIVYLYESDVREYMIERTALAKDPSQLKWRTITGQVIDANRILKILDKIADDLYKEFNEIYQVFSKKTVYITDACETMATDGRCMFLNPLWCYLIVDRVGKSKGIRALEYVIVHEMMHILFDHCVAINDDRFPDGYRVNDAMDYELNYVIENYLYDSSGNLPFKGMTAACGGCYDESFGERGLSWEEIYPLIPARERKNPKSNTSDEWKKGFLDGFDVIMKALRKRNLVERYEL